MKTATLNFARLPKTYSGLVALHMPRPIHDKVVEDYESGNVPEPKPVKGIEALKFLLEENSLTADDLSEIIGVDRSIAYRILKGVRNLTADHIKTLAARFAVSADLFLA